LLIESVYIVGKTYGEVGLGREKPRNAWTEVADDVKEHDDIKATYLMAVLEKISSSLKKC